MANQELNAEGLNCPLPIIKAKKALKGMEPGDVLSIRATDPGSVADFAAFCSQTGNELISQGQASSNDKLAAVVGCLLDDSAQICLVIAENWQNGHHAGAGQDTGVCDFAHGGKSFLGRRSELFNAADLIIGRGTWGANDAKDDHCTGALIDLLQ